MVIKPQLQFIAVVWHGMYCQSLPREDFVKKNHDGSVGGHGPMT